MFLPICLSVLSIYHILIEKKILYSQYKIVIRVLAIYEKYIFSFQYKDLFVLYMVYNRSVSQVQICSTG